MNRFGLIGLILFTLFSKLVFSQNVSNEGTDFWAVFPTHVASGNGGTTTGNHANLSIFVTSKSNSIVTVSCGLAYSETKNIPANTSVEFVVDWASAYIPFSSANGNLLNKGIHIKVADGSPKVSAYAHIYGQARSAASLILPYETLGQTYYSMNYTQNAGGNNYLTLVAVEDNTSILLHSKSGGVITINLDHAGDVYEYISGSDDLTGVYAEINPASSSCKRFAAFSGSSVVTIVCNGSQDPLYQQLYPTVSWGRNYGVVPFKDRRYILRILAQEDNTKVIYNGLTTIINKGKYIESDLLTESTFITADKLISVAQYSLTQACSSTNGGNIIGDPEMVMLNPIEFNIKGITVFSSPLQNILVRYINVLIRTSQTATFKINNLAPNTTWTPLTGNSSFSFAQIPISEISLTLTADDGFNAIAYGFGNAESYSYSAGTNLSSNNYLTVVNESTNEESPNGCIGQQVDFKVNLPYQPDKITWTLEGEMPEVVINPVAEIKVVNGQNTYIYKYPVNKVYTVTGEYHLEVLAHVENNATNCINGDLTTNYVFNIYDLPTAKFIADIAGCAKSDILFTDRSISNTTDFAITDWIWDLGDGSTSTDRNPKHQYATEGNYNVTLSVKSGTGCYSDPAPLQSVHINPLPESKFSIDHLTSCINTNVLFTDQSIISTALTSNSKIIKWHWDFGDGTSEDKTDKLPFTHPYLSVGTFSVVLTTTSDNGCTTSSLPQSLTITNLPIADFSLPDVCFDDGVAKFINLSKNTDGTTNGLTYEWDFGDPSSTNNLSDDKDGSHIFSAPDKYFIILKVINENGCIISVSKDFTINGQVKNAEFTVQNENNLCSNNDVIINNISEAISGKITKIEVYQDFGNNPTDKITIDFPTTVDIPLHYTSFGGNADKIITIKLIAYSGIVCSKEFIKTITLRPSPILQFNAIPTICENDGLILLNQASETSGTTGSGIYSIDGINFSGNFNPKLTGVGTHNIMYTYTTPNGCALSITKTITVNASPTADSGPDIFVLAGGEVTIPATAQGSNLTYQWTPALGLSKNNILNPVVNPDQDTEYTLTVTTNPEGCTATSKVKVKVLQALDLRNTFTPNGDNVNDVWTINYLETYPNATVEIFNRNGNRVFFSSGYKIPFDGNYQNQPLPVGVYYYIINPRNGRKILTGPLTLLR
ncbi:PKD domain-containing protein [Pedobacter mucosus]|uniref:PKD domain-containing protein n=1 Tax=Pedobacter mucosus TaxID=2895286 RepID=UPI001EE407A7|nr:PKD domain-containing protein [Pedobacter mucosus]UKT65118.1 PKD domain-containing protein [Pedobacter mucosus]